MIRADKCRQLNRDTLVASTWLMLTYGIYDNHSYLTSIHYTPYASSAAHLLPRQQMNRSLYSTLHTRLNFTHHTLHLLLPHQQMDSSLFSNILHTPHTSQFYIPYASSSAPTSANEQFTITILHTRLNFTHHTPHLLLICSHVSK